MKLRELLVYDEIVVQCHDNPDADAIASGYALYTYLKSRSKQVRLVYGGANRIRKANLCLMVELLQIPIEYIEAMKAPQLLVTIDCQYGEGNVTRFEAERTAVIDHHQPTAELPDLHEVRSNLGSCSTVIWDMLREEGYAVNENKPLATALYYGLLTDTGNFTEISHPLDKDLRDEMEFDRSIITRFRNTNLSLSELVIAGKALIAYEYDERYRFSLVQAEPCDPNILGMISDLVLEVDVVDTCLVYSVLPAGIKLSVRSCIKEVKASELAAVVTQGVGSGGGHLQKAGGFVQKSLLPCGTEHAGEFFKERLMDYFANTEVIYAKEYSANLAEYTVWQKCELSLGYVRAAELFRPGTRVNIRTMEGDLDVEVSGETYIMIGIEGEVYPIMKPKFLGSYQPSEKPYVFEGEYGPTIRDTQEGTVKPLVPYAHTCISTGGVQIYARPLERRMKVFTAWDEEKYMLGMPGDYLAVRKDDPHDIYVIAKNIFHRTYQPKPE